MKTIGIQNLLILIPGALVLVACQQPGQISTGSKATVLSSLSGTGDVSEVEDYDPSLRNEEDDDVPPVSDYLKYEGRGDCGKFLNAAGAVLLGVPDDLEMIGTSGNTNIKTPVRNLTMQDTSGNTRIWSAANASVDGSSGNLDLNAGNISKLDGISGNLCVGAKTIGSIANGSGNTHVVAQSIDSVTVHSGNFHIYGATIKEASGISGNICLHNGAKVLSLKDFSGNIKTDCK